MDINFMNLFLIDGVLELICSATERPFRWDSSHPLNLFHLVLCSPAEKQAFQTSPLGDESAEHYNEGLSQNEMPEDDDANKITSKHFYCRISQLTPSNQSYSI
jgi:hypothetical protein